MKTKLLRKIRKRFSVRIDNLTNYVVMDNKTKTAHGSSHLSDAVFDMASEVLSWRAHRKMMKKHREKQRVTAKRKRYYASIPMKKIGA